MSKIESIHEDVVNGIEGFVINWEFVGLTKASAKFRAVGQTALRFPTTITDASVVDVERNVTGVGEPNFIVSVFVPTEGFGSAGIGNPVEWMKNQFGDRFSGRR